MADFIAGGATADSIEAFSARISVKNRAYDARYTPRFRLLWAAEIAASVARNLGE